MFIIFWFLSYPLALSMRLLKELDYKTEVINKLKTILGLILYTSLGCWLKQRQVAI